MPRVSLRAPNRTGVNRRTHRPLLALRRRRLGFSLSTSLPGPSMSNSIRGYIFTYIALLALVGATLGLAFVPLGPNGRYNTVIALAIALAKACLIAIYFMHLKNEKG